MEQWKPIKGCEGYYWVSNFGNIKSYKNKHERILSTGTGKHGHSFVVLTRFGKRKTYLVSRIVAEEFMPNPDDKPYVCHKDETLIDGKLSNSVDNLWWGTHSENMKDCFSKGRANNHLQLKHPRLTLGKVGKEHPRSRPIAQYSKDGIFIEKYESIKEASLKTGSIHQNICSCCNGKYGVKSAGGFIWKYL